MKNKTITDDWVEKRIISYFKKHKTNSIILISAKNKKSLIRINKLSDRTPLQKLLEVHNMDLLSVKYKTGISYPTLIDINRGYKIVGGKKVKYAPNKRTLKDIAELFNVPVNEFLDDYKNYFK